MTMLYSFHDNLDIHNTDTQFEVVPSHSKKHTDKASEVHLFAEKLRVPRFDDQVVRPRLNQLLLKSSRQFGATLLLGRAGTGKTALAAEFAKRYKKVAWFSIDSADKSWNVFSKYFAASFNEPLLLKDSSGSENSSAEISSQEIAYFVESLLVRLSIVDSKEPRLIVLDNAHHVFDSEWFTSFFSTLVYALSPNTHFIMLSRCEPALPLWRLRSKQILGVIDEKLLSFNYDETKSLFKDHSASQNTLVDAYSRSFGRISKLKEIVNSI